MVGTTLLQVNAWFSFALFQWRASNSGSGNNWLSYPSIRMNSKKMFVDNEPGGESGKNGYHLRLRSISLDWTRMVQHFIWRGGDHNQMETFPRVAPSTRMSHITQFIGKMWRTAILLVSL